MLFVACALRDGTLGHRRLDAIEFGDARVNDQLTQLGNGVAAILLLRALTRARQTQLAVAVDARAVQLEHALLDRVGQPVGARHIEAQVAFRIDLVDILTA